MDLFLISLCFTTVSTVKVLMIVPTLSYSHISFNVKIAETLESKGHKVVMLLPDIDDKVLSPPSNIELIRRDVGLAPGELSSTLWTNPNPYEDSSPLNPRILLKLLRVSSLFVKACKALANDNVLLDSLRERHFDIGMLEQYDSCGFGIFRAIGVNSIVWLSATGAYAEQPQTIGVNYPLSYVPNLFAPLGDEMSFLNRVQNVLVSTVTGLVFSYTRAQQSQIFWRTGVLAFGEDLLSTARHSDSVVMNTLPFLDFAMPTSHQITYIGGSTIQKQQRSLDPFWRGVADSSGNGFVLVTFGSIAKTVDMPILMQRKMFTAFSRFPKITFIVKYETLNSTLPIPSNVQLTQWIPQAELMAHPNYLAIVTHGGWSSILESISVEKPLVLMPLFADHGKNSKVMEAKGAAVIIHKMRLTLSDLTSAIAKVTLDPKYREACAKLSRMMDDTPALKDAHVLNHLVQRAAKRNTERFPLTPQEPSYSSFTIYLQLFVIVAIALTSITLSRKSLTAK